ncbi:hypothetical protein [Rubidibacter lacunae]|uniref:hypothetical protein n=1 Tax=Rubidibacter lacunae TaxID=582514 RepID=UPI0003FADD26|nr:hypothetical protein [Rubidibacter lacunae]
MPAVSAQVAFSIAIAVWRCCSVTTELEVTIAIATAPTDPYTRVAGEPRRAAMACTSVVTEY